MLGCFNSLLDIDENLVAKATSYMFASKALQKQDLSI
jgi:hypothetical protein